ncbi:MAG: AAA family ATPase [Catenulispora sp.]|nr:AAA family ATPase [Catenulispora sp.]
MDVRGIVETMSPRTAGSRFIGREAEFAQLLDALAEAETAVPRTVVVGGEAGVGKSRLLEEFAAEAAGRGALVLVGGCVELAGEDLPYSAIAEALRGLRREPDVALTRLLDGRVGEIGRLVPELGLTPSVPGDEEFGRMRLFGSVVMLLERLAADRTVVLAVEDLHWSGQSTRELLEYLAKSLRGVKVLIIVTCRSDDLGRGHPVRTFLAELERVRSVERFELPRFSRAEVAEQLHGILGFEPRPSVVSEVFERAEGNAFFTEEIARFVGADVVRLPESLRDLLLARVDRLPEPTRRVLRLTAVGGQTIEHRLLVAVSDTSEDDLAEALRPAVAANVLVLDAGGEGYRFQHALVREAIRDDLLPGERIRTHRRFAEALESAAAESATLNALIGIAHHRYAAHDLHQAFPAAIRASAAANRSAAHDSELQMLERAIELRDHAAADSDFAGDDGYLRLLARAALAAAHAGNAERCLALAREGLRQACEPSASRYVAELLEHYSNAVRGLGKGDGLAELRQAVSLIGEEDLTVRARLLATLAAALMLTGHSEESLEISDQAIELARQRGLSTIEDHARLTRGGVLVSLGRVGEGLAEQYRAYTSPTDHYGRSTGSRGYVNLSSALQNLDRYAEAETIAREGLADEVAAHSPVSGTLLRTNLADALIAQGRWDEADALLALLDESLPMTRHVHAAAVWCCKAKLAAWRGDLPAADRYLRRARELGLRDSHEPQYYLVHAEMSMLVATAQGQIEEVRAELDHVLARGLPAGYEWTAWPILASAARAEADAAERARARRASAESGYAGRIAIAASELRTLTPSSRAYAAIVEAELARQAGEPALSSWQRAQTPAEDVARHVLGYVLFRIAEALTAAGERDAAAAAATRAAEIADVLCLAPLRDEIDLLTRRARLVPEPEAASPLGLTARELEVLRLVAEGLSNGQIGGRLFITTKTASAHVSNILAKLGVSSRGEAAALAHRSQVFDTTEA